MNQESWDILLGEFNGLDQVTFINVFADGGSTGRGGTWRKLNVSTLIKGKHIFSQNDLHFKRIILKSPAMEDWIRPFELVENVEHNLIKIPDKKKILSIDSSNFNISVHIEYFKQMNGPNLLVEKACFWELKSEGTNTLDSFSEIIRRIKRWILFVTNKDPEFSEYTVIDEKEESLTLITTSKNLNEHKFSQNLTLRYYDIESVINKMLTSWLEKDKLESIIELIQGKEYNTELSFQGCFLNMCVAIESLDYIFGDESLNPNIDSRIKDREKIISMINNDDLKKLFIKETENWGKSRYRERLKKYNTSFKHIMGDTFKCSTKQFIHKIVSTRNSLAHSGTYEGNLKHIELLLYGKVIEFVVKKEILKLFELDNNYIEKIDNESKRHVKILANLNNYS